MTSMSVQCHYTYNSELHHLRMGEYRKTDDDKQACIIEFVLLSPNNEYSVFKCHRCVFTPLHAPHMFVLYLLTLLTVKNHIVT